DPLAGLAVEPLAFLACGLVGCVLELGREIDAVVPDLERTHVRELPHPLAVGADSGGGDVEALLVVQTDVSPGDDEARHEPLDVPLPRAGHRLVEVVEAEHDVSFGRREEAEVHEVAIAARLYLESGG